MRRQSLAASYKQGLIIALIFQVLFILLGTMTFDSGDFLRSVILSILGYWIVALIIVLRRPTLPSRFDLAVIRSGFIVILFIVVALISTAWLLKGH